MDNEVIVYTNIEHVPNTNVTYVLTLSILRVKYVLSYKLNRILINIE